MVKQGSKAQEKYEEDKTELWKLYISLKKSHKTI